MVSSGMNEPIAERGKSVVLCGSFRRDPEQLKAVYLQLQELGLNILSPAFPNAESEKNGFVYLQNETGQDPMALEQVHLAAIKEADFVWFFAPGGYVGATGAMEIGFAHANGIPIYAETEIADVLLRSFVQKVVSPAAVLQSFRAGEIEPPEPAIDVFQNYYRKVVSWRGYENEGPKDCLLLMMEEIGELSRALRKEAKLKRHGKPITNRVAEELADVFIYVVHMANILKLNLGRIVRQKEMANIAKTAANPQ